MIEPTRDELGAWIERRSASVAAPERGRDEPFYDTPPRMARTGWRPPRMTRTPETLRYALAVLDVIRSGLAS